MASRKTQKEAARERRLAEEQASALKARRARRRQMVGGLVAVGVVVVGVLAVTGAFGGSSSKAIKPNSPGAKSTTASVTKLLSGIPQSGTTLGKPSAPVTVTEYGDLQCPICADFAKGGEDQLISNEVRSGKVKLVYKSFETATSNGPDAGMWNDQQSAAYAAGAQGKAWNYIETFYREQRQEGTSYVNPAFINGIAKQVQGLDFKKWGQEHFNPAYAARIMKESSTAGTLSFQGQAGTPALIAAGPKRQTKPIAGNLTYSNLQSMIKSVQ